MARNIYLTQKELEDIADNISEISDDGLDFSDTDSINDPEYIVDDAEEIAPIENTEDEGNLSDNIVEQDEIRNQQSTKSTKSKDKVNITWKNKNLVLSDLQKAFHGSESLSPELLELNTPYEAFHGSESLSPELLELNTPYECFSYIFTDKNPNKSSICSRPCRISTINFICPP
ncbi:hypothetical protein QE152_g39797 [Popillia japonica]|uniref:PiggyBac transposable element-derived protein domain-containing protein n=1 Tax=Popillia japonica TaxID=7064 RepID=A0AAW1HTS4_POPJA